MLGFGFTSVLNWTIKDVAVGLIVALFKSCIEYYVTKRRIVKAKGAGGNDNILAFDA